MTAVQIGPAAGISVGPEMGYSLSGMLPGLLAAIAVLCTLQLAVSIILLVSFRQLAAYIKKRPWRTVKPRTDMNSSSTQSASPNKASGTRRARDESKSQQQEPRPRKRADNANDEQEHPFFSVAEPSQSIPDSCTVGNGEERVSGTSMQPVQVPIRIYPVKVSGAVNYNPLLSVTFEKTSEGNSVFALWSDRTIRPVESCFLGFNAPAFYNSHRFSLVYDFADGEGTKVNIAGIQAMKLMEIEQYPVVASLEGDLTLVKKGKIRVEVKKYT